MKLIDGLYFHELVLLGLGILLFITILILLIIFAVQKRRLRELVLFFFLSIIMIGYPSIQKIVYDNGVVTIDKYAKTDTQFPPDSTRQSQMEIAMGKIEGRPTSNSKTILDLGKVHAILGDTVKAEKLVDRALLISPDFSEARKLQAEFNTPQVQIEKMITEIEKNPGNITTRNELEKKISSLQITSNSGSSVMTTAAKAQILLGDTSKAIALTNRALQKDSENIEATALRKRITKTIPK